MSFNHYISNYTDQGDGYYNHGNYRDALRFYNKGLKLDGKNVLLLIKKGNSLFNLKKKSDAYWSYFSAFFNSDAFDLIDEYVNQYGMDLERDLVRFNDLLKWNYDIPISRDGLLMFLKQTLDDLDERRRLKEFERFKVHLDGKYLVSLREYVDIYLRYFGERYKRHFLSFFCYLVRDRGFPLNMGKLAVIIMDRSKLIELERFEHLLKSGGRKQTSLDHMTGIQFQDYIATLFETRGDRVTRNPLSHDKGADLLIEEFGFRIAVQTKRRKQTIGIKAVQEVYSAQCYYGAQRALVITSNRFTKPAIEMADRLGVELWDRKRLLDEIKKFEF